MTRLPTSRTDLLPLEARVAIVIGLAALMFAPSTSPAQGGGRTATKFYPDFSDTADALLRNAAGHARDRQWAEAIEIYQRVIQQFGEKVARLPKDDPSGDPAGDSILYADVRHFCQQRLAQLPLEARAVYRSRVDVQAERWFRQGEKSRDGASLRRVVDEAFCSSWGDDAVELLGDLAFQDGRFEEALDAYRRLVADGTGTATDFVYPDASVDLPRVAAKKLICRQALGESPIGQDDLDQYAKIYPDSRGALAGREGLYRETLSAVFTHDRLALPVQPDGRWPTFAGAPSRTHVVPDPVDVGSLQWRVELDAVKVGTGRPYRGVNMVSGPTHPDKLLAYHPIVLGDQVIVCDAGQILAYDLNDRPTGRPGSLVGAVKLAWKHDEEQGGGGPQATRMTVGIPRFTLTAVGDRIYARMGLTSVPFMGGRMAGGSQSYLVAVDQSTDGKILWKKLPGDVTISRKPGDNTSRNLGFEGTPVADVRNVYVAMTDRREQITTYVVCLDGATGATRWVKYLGAASADAENMFGMGMGGMGMGGGASPGDFGHRLLSLDGSAIYYQTNLGAVVALDAETGGIRWVATYPRQDRLAGGTHDRDLNPAVIYNGLVIVAPDDANAIYAFDAASGRLAWKTDPLPNEVKLSHLLGVAKGRLIATGDRVLLFDVKTGKLLHSWPDSGHGFEGYGRGLLAGDKIYWPTRNEIHVLFQETGLRSDPPIRLQETFQESGGNLAVGDGYLIVAQERKLVVFCQNRRLMQRYREEIARAPDQAAPYYRLGQAAEATGADEVALASLETAVRLGKTSDTIDGNSLIEAGRDHRFRLLMKMGEKARTAGALPASEGRFREAAGAARVGRDRLRARLAEADVQLQRGAAVESVGTLQSLLAETELRGLSVSIDSGRRTIRSDLLIADRLASTVRDKGQAVYARYDREAGALLDRGKTSGDPRLLEEVARNFPIASVVPDAWLALGRLHQAGARPAEAVRAYKRLLASPASEERRASALVELARTYESRKFWASARETYALALRRFPKVEVEDDQDGKARPLGPLVSARLSRPPFNRMTGDRSEPTLPVPLARLWTKLFDSKWRPIAAEGAPPSLESSSIFLARGTEVRPILADDGPSPWTADLGGTPLWVGYLDDRVLAASEDRLVAVDMATGRPLWKFDAALSGTLKPTANPFDRPAAARSVAESDGKLHGFRVVASQVYCLRGERELIAIDGETGQINWSFSATTGTLNPNLLITPERILLQIRKPNAALVLEAETGRRCVEFPLDADVDWARPPLSIDTDRVVIVSDRRTVILFDVARGVNAWTFRESQEMPKNGPPLVFGDAERLLLVHDGNELIRLDAATGSKSWARPLGVENLSGRPEALAADADRIYWVNNRTLNGALLADGSLVWSRYLSGPEAGWSIDLTDRCVLAYPGLPRKSDGELEGLPLVFRRRSDGALVQRLLLSAPVSDVAVRLAPGGVLVATQAGVWALGDRSPVDGAPAGR